MTQPQDMQELIRQAAEVQAALQQAQMELLQTEVTGTAGGELVTVTMTGGAELVDLQIDKSVVTQRTSIPCRTWSWARSRKRMLRPAAWHRRRLARCPKAWAARAARLLRMSSAATSSPRDTIKGRCPALGPRPFADFGSN